MNETNETSETKHTNGGTTHGFAGIDPEELREAFAEHEGRIREFVTAHPVPVLIGAVAAGFLLARLARGSDS